MTQLQCSRTECDTCTSKDEQVFLRCRMLISYDLTRFGLATCREVQV